MSGIYLDSKHGVAPTMLHCPICLEASGLALPGRMINRMAADAKKSPERFMREGMLDTTPCQKCQGFMEQGIILIGVDEKKTTDRKNPWRTGRFSVIREEAVRRIFSPPELVEDVCKRRVCYMPDEVFVALGIPETMEENADAKTE